MSTEPNQIALAKPSALCVMAARLSVEPEKMLKTLKDTVFKGANDSELLALVVVANEYNLNPLLKEIYAFPVKGGGIQPIVSIDGWAKIINRQPKLDGLEFEEFDSEDGKPVKKTCVISVKGRKKPVKVTERYDECFRATEPWKTMPHRMLRHKALIQCARYAFGLSGIQDEDEARDSLMKKADAREVARAALPNFSNEPEPEIEAREEAKTTEPSGEQVASGSEGADGGGEANATGQPAPAAPAAKSAEELWNEA